MYKRDLTAWTLNIQLGALKVACAKKPILSARSRSGPAPARAQGKRPYLYLLRLLCRLGLRPPFLAAAGDLPSPLHAHRERLLVLCRLPRPSRGTGSAPDRATSSLPGPRRLRRRRTTEQVVLTGLLVPRLRPRLPASARLTAGPMPGSQ